MGIDDFDIEFQEAGTLSPDELALFASLIRRGFDQESAVSMIVAARVERQAINEFGWE